MNNNPSCSSSSSSRGEQQEEAGGESSRVIQQKQEDDHAAGAGIIIGTEDADELSPPRCEWEFRLAASVPSPALPGASDAIGSIDLDPTGRFLATGGIARKIRMYSVASLLLLDDNDDQQALVASSCICVPAKLSSVRWRPTTTLSSSSSSSPSLVGCGDYDGVVTEYDVERGLPAWERDEHSGRRVWALDYAPAATMAASGSDDRTAHVWDPRAPSAGWATARAGGAVLCVEFDPSGGPQLAVGSADRRAAVYDVRALGRGPVAWMDGHGRPVTYVRWAGRQRVVTSAADGTHRLWETTAAAAAAREVRCYSGHASARSFVGMGVWRQPGLVASGSESNHVFVYDLRWAKPIWVHPFVSSSSEAHNDPNAGPAFVSAVAWRQGGPPLGLGLGCHHGTDDDDTGTLVAGGSDGALKMFTCQRRKAPADQTIPSIDL
ncbi:hypothetical protein QOZ80_2AG0099170 [Eleusine coracana subsp. coracana]|nr:hypothetical protein QOZ80_2AG0099170 [Eleusine coracana subsp. coracana]